MRHILMGTAFILAVAGCNKPGTQYEVTQVEPGPASSTGSYDPGVFDVSDGGSGGAYPVELASSPMEPAPYSAPVATETYASSEASAGGQVHVVQRKETLYALARQYYNDAKQWRRIYEANRERISDPNRISVGMKLIIP